jgi:PKD repeat protein
LWNQVATEVNGGISIFLFAATGISSASNLITINLTGATSTYIANFAEFTIPGFTGTIDQSAVSFGNTGTTVSSGTITTPLYPEEMWVALLTSTASSIGSPSNGFSEINSATNPYIGGAQTALLAYKVVAAIAPASTSATFVPSGGDEWTGAIFALVLPSTLQATASATPSTVNTGTSVQFTGLAVGGSPAYTYSWNFGDGTTSALQNPTHTYAAAGTYTATLTVTDSMGNTSAASVPGNIIVNPLPPIYCPILMLVSDYLLELRARFAEINFTTWIPDSQLIAWLNLGMDDIQFRTLPPRYEVYPPYQISSVGYQSNYPLPTNYFRLKEFGDTSGLFFNGDALLFEDKTAELEQFQFSDLMSSNNPVWFWFWANQFFIYPPPVDNTGVIKTYYHRLPNYVCLTTDTVDVDRPWTEVLIKFVLWKSLEKDKHPMSQVYRQEYEQGLSNQYSESRIRVERRARYVHSHDFWGREDR